MTLSVTRRRAEPRDLLAALRESESATRFYWRSADGSVELMGLGEAATLEAAGPERLARAAARARELWAGLAVDGVETPPEAGPLLVGGFGFWDEPAAE